MKNLMPIAYLCLFLWSANASALTSVPECEVQDETIQITPDLNCLSVAFGADSFTCPGNSHGPHLLLENHCEVDVMVADHPELYCPTSDCWGYQYTIEPNESIVMAIRTPSSDYLRGISGTWLYEITLEEDTYKVEVGYTIAMVERSSAGGCQQFGAGNSVGWIMCLMGALWVARKRRFRRLFCMNGDGF